MAPEPTDQALGAALRSVREELGLTLVAAGKPIKVGKTGMSSRELGDTRLWPVELAKIEDAFGVPRGTVYRRAGFVVDPAGPVEQIDSWTFLTPQPREMLHRMVDPEWETARRSGVEPG